MKNAHINSNTAVTPAGGTSLVRRLLACALIGAAAMSVAHAGPGRGQQAQQSQDYSRDADPRQQRQYDDRQQQRQYDDRQQRQFDERAFQARADEQRRQLEQQQQSNEGRRGGRMTPDERRDLRRQINEAGADIYPNHGRRR
jgi:hypothetical protein